MKVGTAETIIEEERRRRLRSGLSGGTGPGQGKNRPGGGGDNGSDGPGGSDDPGRWRPDELVGEPRPDAPRILTYFVLIVVLMTFGGLVGAYIVIATNRAAEWAPFDLPIQVWISTVLILLSSVSYYFAERSLDTEDVGRARKWLVATTVLGAAFISSQILAWLELTSRGLYMRGNPYAGFFYLLTAIHALHVIGGLTALGTVVLRVWNLISGDAVPQKTRIIAQAVGWYWHFMGMIWLALFVLLGFWK